MRFCDILEEICDNKDSYIAKYYQELLRIFKDYRNPDVTYSSGGELDYFINCYIRSLENGEKFLRLYKDLGLWMFANSDWVVYSLIQLKVRRFKFESVEDAAVFYQSLSDKSAVIWKGDEEMIYVGW